MRARLIAPTLKLAIATVMCGALALATASKTQAQTVARVESAPKASIGLGLIGAELGFVIPALAGARDTWPYVVFPIIGAAGGAIAGHFALQQDNNSPNPEISVALLAVGLAFVIPALVITVANTQYDPTSDAPPEEEVPEPTADDLQGDGDDGATPTAAPAPANEAQPAQPATPTSLRLRGGLGLVTVANGQLFVGAPAVSVGQSLTPEESRQVGGVQYTEVRVPLVSALF